MRFYLFLALLINSCALHCQKELIERIDSKSYSTENVLIDFSELNNDSLSYFTTKFLNECFLNCPSRIEENFDLTRGMLNRIKLIEFSSDDLENCKNVSETEIKSKCNPSLGHSKFKSVIFSNFNPIAYRIDFLKSEDQVFRLYNTNYVMYIKRYSN